MKRRNLLALILMALAGLLIFGLEQKIPGYTSIAISLVAASRIDRKMLRDLSLVAIGLFSVSLVPITTDISFEHMAIMGSALVAAITIPYFISRYLYKDHTIKFPFGLHEPWGRGKWLYLLLVLVVGYFILPVYMINSGVYLNWPAVSDTSSVIRLFVGTNALGIWDELFFICVAFTVFRRYAPFWTANILQAVLFTSFLYELGFESYGPILIFIFALTQGYLFKLTHSVFYLLCVHLLFDFILFLVLIHSHHREILSIFFY